MKSYKKLALRRPLTKLNIFHLILDINIQALDGLIEEDDLKKWEILMDNYQSSLEEVKKRALEIRDDLICLREVSKNAKIVPLISLQGLETRWYNTLKSTLYMMEGDLILENQESINELWGDFFYVDEQRTDNMIKPLEIRKLW